MNTQLVDVAHTTELQPALEDMQMSDDLRDRLTRVETKQELQSEGFANALSEVKTEYKKINDRLDAQDKKIFILITASTLLAQGAGQLAGPLLKLVMGH